MATASDTSDSRHAHQDKLRAFTNWLIPCTFGFAAFELTAYVIFRQLPLLILVVTLLCYGTAQLIARRRAARGHIRSALLLLCIGIMIVGLVSTIVLPALFVTVVLVPLLASVVALPYLDARTLRSVLIGCWLVTITLAFIDLLLPPVFAQPPALVSQLLRMGSLIVGSGLIMLLLWQFSSRLTEMLAETQTANERLQLAQASLETQVIERTAALQTALSEVEARAAEQARLLAENEQQRQTIRELSVPVLPISADALVMPLVGTLDHGRLQDLIGQALAALERSKARLLLLDITGVPTIDTPIAQGLVAVVQAGRLLGATVVLVGIRPEVAQTLVALGVNLNTLQTFSDLQSALTQLSTAHPAATRLLYG